MRPSSSAAIIVIVASYVSSSAALLGPGGGVSIRNGPTRSASPALSRTIVRSQWKRNLDEAGEKMKKAGSGGAAETATGAVLGGVLLGPFGALFGAQIGANLGARRAAEAFEKEKMERMGVTPEMLEMVQEAGVTLNRAIDGLKATQDSLSTQQRIARRLDEEVDRLYDEAKAAMLASDETKARELLFERDQRSKKLKKTLEKCIEERNRVEMMKRNVEAIEERAIELESLLNRSVSAKALSDSSDFSLPADDPLLEKFRNL
mmetsp:Transcript_12017/g.18099  ORF Transcript_12017/g.18099 Transcript_12017/m.18099 type:complete len:262 (+) Transcript_12017:38-823(+)